MTAPKVVGQKIPLEIYFHDIIFNHHLFYVMFLLRSQANDLAVVIARMQSNADQVEKNILRAEELLAVVRKCTCTPDLDLNQTKDTFELESTSNVELTSCF